MIGNSPAEPKGLMARSSRKIIGLLLAICATCTNRGVVAQFNILGVLPEQREIVRQDPADLPRVRIPADATPPPTVSRRPEPAPQASLELDVAIRQALDNTDVVRVLAGVGAASSGQTIFDPAIATARIDQQQAIFDPSINVRNDFLRDEPVALGNRLDTYNLQLGASKPLITGGRFDVGMDVNRNRQRPTNRLLNPQTQSSASLSVTQPLLKGAGVDVNLVPIVLGGSTQSLPISDSREPSKIPYGVSSKRIGIW